MAKTQPLDYDITTASNNSDLNSIGIAGTNAVSNFDNAFRELMLQIGNTITRHVTKAAGTYAPAKTDHNQLWRATGAVTLNLTAAATLTSGWALWLKADGGAILIDPSSSETINGATTLTIPNGSSAYVVCTGTAFFAIVFAAAINPASSTDNAIARYDGTLGLLQNSSVTIDDSGNLAATNISAGAFVATNNVFSTSVAATLVLRPNGIASSVGQMTVAATGAATVNGTLTTTGAANITGNSTINGTLTVTG